MEDRRKMSGLRGMLIELWLLATKYQFRAFCCAGRKFFQQRQQE